jgi:hypothetical protein
VVDGSDYTLIDNAFNTQGTQLTAAIATAQIAGGISADFGEFSRAVPEPVSISALAMGGIALLVRRRRCLDAFYSNKYVP